MITDDLKKVDSKVMHILQKYPQCRDSDKLLWLAYNCMFNDLQSVLGLQNYNKFKAWLLQENTPVFESLSRARRKIQENHPHLEGAKAARMELEAEVREMMS